MIQSERFEVNIKSIEGSSDAYELATLQIRDTLSQKDYEFSIWADDYENQIYDPYSVYIKNPSNIDFNQDENMQDIIGNSLDDYILSDLIAVNKTLEETIKDGYENGLKFNIKIPKEIQNVDFTTIVADLEITKLIEDIDAQKLNIRQLIQFGNSFDKEDIDLHNIEVKDYLKDEITEFLSKKTLTETEQNGVKELFEVLHLKNENENLIEKKQGFEMER